MKTREFFPCAGHDWCVRGEKTAVGVLALVKPLVDIGLGGIGLFPAGVFMMKWANRRVFTMKCISGNGKHTTIFLGLSTLKKGALGVLLSSHGKNHLTRPPGKCGSRGTQSIHIWITES